MNLKQSKTKSKLNIDESSKLQKLLISSFFVVLWQTSQKLVIRFFGCYYFKSCLCWTWRGSDTHARSFICTLIWNGTGYSVLCRICECNWRAHAHLHSITAGRTGKVVFTDIWPDNRFKDSKFCNFDWRRFQSDGAAYIKAFVPSSDRTKGTERV